MLRERWWGCSYFGAPSDELRFSMSTSRNDQVGNWIEAKFRCPNPAMDDNFVARCNRWWIGLTHKWKWRATYTSCWMDRVLESTAKGELPFVYCYLTASPYLSIHRSKCGLSDPPTTLGSSSIEFQVFEMAICLLMTSVIIFFIDLATNWPNLISSTS